MLTCRYPFNINYAKLRRLWTSNGKLTVVNFSKSTLNLSDLNLVVDNITNQIALRMAETL